MILELLVDVNHQIILSWLQCYHACVTCVCAFLYLLVPNHSLYYQHEDIFGTLWLVLITLMVCLTVKMWF